MIIEKTIQDIKAITGLPEEEIRAHIEDWAIPLMTKGVIVKLEIKHWRGKSQMDRMDIGLNEEDPEWADFSNEYLTYGSKTLLPRRIIARISRIESLARRNVKEYSFDTVWGKFIPCTIFNEWKVKNEDIREEYFREADRIYDEYDIVIEEVCEEYKKFARIIFNKMKNKEIDYSDFERDFIENIRKNIIGKDQFLSSFSYNSFYYFIPLPSEIEKDLLETEKSLNERENINSEREMRQKISEETFQKKSQYIEQFLESTVGRMREMILNIIAEVKIGMTIDKNSLNSGKTKQKLMTMIEKIRALDFYDDSEVRDALDKLQIHVEKENKFKSDEEIMNSLENLEQVAKAGITGLVAGRRQKMLEI